MYDCTVRERVLRIHLDAIASREPDRKNAWLVEAGPWHGRATTEKAAADTLAERLRAFLTHYERARFLSFRGYTVVLEIDLGDDYSVLTWHWRIMHPDGHVSTSTIHDAASWDEAEAQARYDLAHRTTDWHDDDSVHEAATFLSPQHPSPGDGRCGPDELYWCAAWQRAARAAREAGRDDYPEWADAHVREFALTQPAESVASPQ